MKVRVWDYHVINYIPDYTNRFPKAAPSGSNFKVFLVFVFAYDAQHDAHSCFRNFFTGTKPMQAVYRSEDMEEMLSCYKRRGMPWFSVSAALEVFFDHLINNLVIVNVNGGPEFTYLGLVQI